MKFVVLLMSIETMFAVTNTRVLTRTNSYLVHRFPSTSVPEQDGWIVLAADVAKAKDSFAAGIDLPSAKVVEAPPKVLSEDALRKQSFYFLRPTRTQAFVGPALSLPISALAYAVFAGEPASFEGEGNVGALEDVAFVAAVSIAVLSIIVGCALFLHVVNSPEEKTGGGGGQ